MIFITLMICVIEIVCFSSTRCCQVFDAEFIPEISKQILKKNKTWGGKNDMGDGTEIVSPDRQQRRSFALQFHKRDLATRPCSIHPGDSHPEVARLSTNFVCPIANNKQTIYFYFLFFLHHSLSFFFVLLASIVNQKQCFCFCLHFHLV